VNAQAQTFKDAGEYHWGIECPGETGESASGLYTVHYTVSANDNMQIWTWQLRLIGEVTGAEYSCKDMWIILAIRGGNNYEEPFNQSSTVMIHKNGALFAIAHYSIHMTLNAKGEITNVKVDELTIECL